MKKKTTPGLKIICLNRKASFNYFFENFLEAGIVLKGSEIKSVRDGKVNIADSYAVEKKGELVDKASNGAIHLLTPFIICVTLLKSGILI